MKIVVWKDGTWLATTNQTWEYENDPDWLVTIPQNRAHAAIRALMAAFPDWENDEQCAAVREAEAVLAAADTACEPR